MRAESIARILPDSRWVGACLGLLTQFNKDEADVWRLLNEFSGPLIRDAEDKFVYSMVNKHWAEFSDQVAFSNETKGWDEVVGRPQGGVDLLSGISCQEGAQTPVRSA